jgi:hypothetical protein
MNYIGQVTLQRRRASGVHNKFLKMDHSAFGEVMQKEEEEEEEKEPRHR